MSFQMLFSLLLIILETTKILLAWEHVMHWEQKLKLVYLCYDGKPRTSYTRHKKIQYQQWYYRWVVELLSTHLYEHC